ncbi:MAG: hypothetical protein LBT64_00230 [Puniceicoccales bacterium]|jgi:hypothetical protein|nr:hypothetical protein [Puniceicoccales bacterium]
MSLSQITQKTGVITSPDVMNPSVGGATDNGMHGVHRMSVGVSNRDSGVHGYFPDVSVDLKSKLHRRRSLGEKQEGTIFARGGGAGGIEHHDLYLRKLSSGKLSSGEIPMKMLASQDFIVPALEKHGSRLIEYLNSLSGKELMEFANRYDGIPDVILGVLFARGLDKNLIADEAKHSPQFLKMAIESAPQERLFGLFNGKDPRWLEDVIKDLPENSVRTLLTRTLSYEDASVKRIVENAAEKFIGGAEIVNYTDSDLESRTTHGPTGYGSGKTSGLGMPVRAVAGNVEIPQSNLETSNLESRTIHGPTGHGSGKINSLGIPVRAAVENANVESPLSNLGASSLESRTIHGSTGHGSGKISNLGIPGRAAVENANVEIPRSNLGTSNLGSRTIAQRPATGVAPKTT